jgi:hypothetical protein
MKFWENNDAGIMHKKVCLTYMLFGMGMHNLNVSRLEQTRHLQLVISDPNKAYR